MTPPATLAPPKRTNNPVAFRAGPLAGPIYSRMNDSISSTGALAQRDLDRYYNLLAAELSALKLSTGEASFLVAILQDKTIDPSRIQYLWANAQVAINDRQLDRQLGIEGGMLVYKLQKASLATLTAIVDAAERFWTIIAHVQAGTRPKATQTELLREVGLLSAKAPSAPTTPVAG